MIGQRINWWDSDAGISKKSNVDSQAVEPKNDFDSGRDLIASQQTLIQQQQQTIQSMQAKAPGVAAQSMPVVQPFVVVPYSTPMQPIYHYSDGTVPIGDIDSNYMRVHGMPQNPMTGGMQQNPMMGGMQQNPMMGGMQQNPMMGGMQQNPMNGPMAPANGGTDDFFFTMDEEDEKEVKKIRKKKERTVSAASIIIMILIVLFGTVSFFIQPLIELIGLDMPTDFVSWNAGSITLINSFETIIGVFTGSTAFDFADTLLLVRALLVLGSVFLAIVFLTALFSIGRKGTPIFGKIMAFLAFVAVAVAVVLCILGKDEFTLGITAYILAAISLLVFLVSLFGKRGRSKKKRSRGK